MWCEKMENKDEMAKIVSSRQWYNVPVNDIVGRIKGDINYGNGREEKGTPYLMRFWGEKGETSYPWKSLDSWFITENKRWGVFGADLDAKALVDKTNRSDLWLEAAKGLGLDTWESETPAVPIVLGSKELVYRFWQALLEKGVFTVMSIAPAVPPGKDLIRTAVSALHSEEDLEKIHAAMTYAVKQL